MAAYKGYTDVIEYLLSLNDYDRTTRDEELHTALMEAAMDGHLEVVPFFMKQHKSGCGMLRGMNTTLCGGCLVSASF